MRFAVDVSKCTECKRCMIACSLAKCGEVRMRASRIGIWPQWPEVPEIRVCRFEACAGHPCIGACPVAAIGETCGAVLIDAGACIGCGACETACPYRAIRIENGVAVKCDLCGGHPACVRECVTGAVRSMEVAS